MQRIIEGMYEIDDDVSLGKGGLASVYIARHIRLDKKVVLKAYRKKMQTDDEEKLRRIIEKLNLRREVDALKELNHMYLPKVYDFIVHEGIIYTVMDFIDGESLDKPLSRGERFSQPQIVKWSCALLEALCYLHDNKILHSDIKPANIMANLKNEIRLIDFNISLNLEEENTVIIGLSEGYASPEHYGFDYSEADNKSLPKKKQKRKRNFNITDDSLSSETIVDNPETVIEAAKPESKSFETFNRGSSFTVPTKKVIPDVRSDIYCLGATIYHLLTGRKPNKSCVDVIPLTESDASPSLVYIINKAMEPNPQSRYQTAAEMLEDFRRIHDIDPRTLSFKRSRTIIGLSCAALMVAGGASAFVGLKQTEQIQQALTFAEYSQNAYNDGDVSAAVDYALQALPEQSSIFLPVYVQEAQASLAEALGVYDMSDSYKSYLSLELPSNPFMISMSDDGKTAAAVCSDEVIVFDSETLAIKATLPVWKSALSEIAFTGNDLLIYAGESGVSAFNTQTDSELWQAAPATAIAVSNNGIIACNNAKEDFAYIYDTNGNELNKVSFGGRVQSTGSTDMFANPNDTLFEISNDGSVIAVSFSDGSLSLFDLSDNSERIIMSSSEFTHFEGGFSGDVFAFSASGTQNSIFAAVDFKTMTQIAGFESDGRFGVIVNNNGVYLSNKNLAVKLDTKTGEETELAFLNSDIRTFSVTPYGALVSTENGDCIYLDNNANIISSINGKFPFDFLVSGGDFAIASGRNLKSLRILKYESRSGNDIFRYDADYQHNEARMNKDGTRVMLFSFEGFRLYDINGTVINETVIPDKSGVTDQQFVKESGNLAVIYNNAVRIYSGIDGSVLYEETDLKFVFYTPYGVNTLDFNGVLKLVDLNTGSVSFSENVVGDTALYCGTAVDNKLIGNNTLLGAGKLDSGYVFAVGDGVTGTVFDGDGKKLFSVPASGTCEAFFAEGIVVISPLHGTPSVYDISSGKKISDLEKDAYLTYVTAIGDYILTEYITTNGEHLGVLLDKSYKAVARLPNVTDVYDGEPVFDNKSGILRKSKIFLINELIEYARTIS